MPELKQISIIKINMKETVEESTEYPIKMIVSCRVIKKNYSSKSSKYVSNKTQKYSKG